MKRTANFSIPLMRILFPIYFYLLLIIIYMSRVGPMGWAHCAVRADVSESCRALGWDS